MKWLLKQIGSVLEKLKVIKFSKKDNINIIRALKAQPLFLGLTDKQLTILTKYIQFVTLTPEEMEIHKKINGADLYLILSGRLEASQHSDQNDSLEKLSEYSTNEILNLLSLTDAHHAVHSIMIGKIYEPTTVLVIDMGSFRKNRHYASIHSVLLKNTAYYFYERLKHAEQVLFHTSSIATQSIDKQLEEAKIRVVFGLFVVRMFIILCIYTLSLRGLAIVETGFGDPTIVSSTMLFIVSFFVYHVMIKTHLPLSEFGISTINWRRSVVEGVVFALLLFCTMLVIKLTLITYVSKFQHISLFDFNTGIDNTFHVVSWKKTFIMLAYILFSPIQEFLVRGGLQGSLYCFLTGTKQKRIWVSIIVSNLIFITFHSHISVLFGLTALIPGIVWGWLYSRHKTLIGVSISHILVGISVIFLLGFTELIS